MRWLDRAIEALAALGVIAYGLAAIVTVADILGRVVGLAVAGVVDIVQLFVLAGAWFVIPWAFVAGAHVGVEFVVDALPAALGRLIRAFAALLAGGLLILMLRYGHDAFQTQKMLGDTSQQLGIPIMYFWWPVLIGQAAAVAATGSVLIRLGRQAIGAEAAR